MNQPAANQGLTPDSGPADLGDMIAELDELRDRKRAITKDLDDVTEQFNELKADIINKLDEQGLEMTRTGKATVSISETVVPSVTDWEEVQRYVLENEALYLFQKRLGAGACQELWNSGEVIPGVEPHTKRDLNLRKNTT